MCPLHIGELYILTVTCEIEKKKIFIKKKLIEYLEEELKENLFTFVLMLHYSTNVFTLHDVLALFVFSRSAAKMFMPHANALFLQTASESGRLPAEKE